MGGGGRWDTGGNVELSLYSESKDLGSSLTLTGEVTMDELLNLSEPQFSPL